MKNTILLLASFLLFSCSSTKTKQKEKVKIETEKSVDSAGTSISNVKTEVFTLQKETAVETNQHIEADVKDGDTLQILQFDQDEKLLSKTFFIGNGKASVSNNKKQIEKQSGVIVKNEESKFDDVVFKFREKAKATVKSEQVHKEKKIETPWWFWLIAIAIALFLNYKYKPILWLKNHVARKTN